MRELLDGTGALAGFDDVGFGVRRARVARSGWVGTGTRECGPADSIGFCFL